MERATRSEVPVANGGFPPALDQSTMATPPVTVKEVVSVRDRARHPNFQRRRYGTEIPRARLVTDPTRPSHPPNSSRAPASTHNASFTNLTMESEKFICVRETGAANSVVIVDMENPSQPMKRCGPVT